MNKNKTIVKTTCQSLAVATAASFILSGSPAVADLSPQTDAVNAVVEFDGSDDTVFGGMIAVTRKLHEAVISEIEERAALVEEDGTDWGTLCMARVSDYLNVRDTASKEGAVIAKMRVPDVATIISRQDGWVEIQSGNTHGFISEEFAIFGLEAKTHADNFRKSYAKSNVSALNVRSGASLDSPVIKVLNKDDKLLVNNEAEPVDGWVAVKVDDREGFTSAQYVEIVKEGLGNAITLEEERAIAAQAAAEAAKNQAQGSGQNSSRPSVSYNASVAASADDETLLAALLICEAGSSYEGMLAVGGVVMNRLHAGYAGSIRDVIYQRGQFTPAGSGKVASLIDNGRVTESSRQAAREALAGVDITGGCKNFRASYTGHSGTVIGDNVFF